MTLRGLWLDLVAAPPVPGAAMADPEGLPHR